MFQSLVVLNLNKTNMKNHPVTPFCMPALMIKKVYFVRVLIIYTNVMNFKKISIVKENSLSTKINCASIACCKTTQFSSSLTLIAVDIVKALIHKNTGI